MFTKPLIGAALAAAAIIPAFAQAVRDPATEAARGYATVPSPNEPAVDAAQKPVTQALNGAVAANAQAAADANTDAQAQYELDRAAYMSALAQHDRAVDRTDARYVRQQVAYADAMRAWRYQVAECKRGNRKVCNLPAPTPADFY
jgi:hypothetical protein